MIVVGDEYEGDEGEREEELSVSMLKPQTSDVSVIC